MSYPLFHPSWLGDLPAVMSPVEFSAAFPGENRYIEFKQGISVQRIQEAAVAFSNADGGVLIAGVSPSRQVVGVAGPGEKAKDIHQAMREVRGAGRYDVHELRVGDDVVLVVSIARRHEGFSQVSSGAVLTRRGASNVPLLGPDLSRFLAKRAFHRFELTATPLSLQEADERLRQRLCDSFGWSGSVEDHLREEGYVAIEAGRRVLTVGGALLLLADPQRIGGRPYIDIRRYAGGDSDPDKTWKVHGPIDDQVEKATEDIANELGYVSAIIGAQRVEMPKLPLRVIREAVANAVAHRSYEHAGTATRVDLYPTHIVITSPGGLPEPVTVENLRFQQAARNDLLLKALRRFGLAEDLGKGIDRMEDDMAADLLHPPEFSEDASAFSVTLRLGGVVTSRERAWVRRLVLEDRLEGRAAAVVVEAVRKGAVTNADVRSLLTVDSVQARLLLQALVSSEVFVREGERGGSQYRLSPSLAMPFGAGLTDDQLERMALELAEQGPVTNTLFRDRAGLDRVNALSVLQRLVARGALRQVGERRGTRYVLPVAPSE